jgi:zinc transporter 9
MVHKAPAAFGLTSVLLKQGLSKRSARSHLLLFSLAAPAGALLTWVSAHAMGIDRMGNAENTAWWTGMLLLFSGGTFLYVAMRTMQDSGPGDESHLAGLANGSIDGRESLKGEQGYSIKDLLAAVFGMILPLFLQVGHAH